MTILDEVMKMTDLTKNVLEEATNCGIIDLAYVQDKIDEMKKQKYLEMHPYSITLGKDGFWHTYLPLGNSKRKEVKKKSKLLVMLLTTSLCKKFIKSVKI